MLPCCFAYAYYFHAAASGAMLYAAACFILRHAMLFRYAAMPLHTLRYMPLRCYARWLLLIMAADTCLPMLTRGASSAIAIARYMLTIISPLLLLATPCHYCYMLLPRHAARYADTPLLCCHADIFARLRHCRYFRYCCCRCRDIDDDARY